MKKNPTENLRSGFTIPPYAGPELQLGVPGQIGGKTPSVDGATMPGLPCSASRADFAMLFEELGHRPYAAFRRCCGRQHVDDLVHDHAVLVDQEGTAGATPAPSSSTS